METKLRVGKILLGTLDETGSISVVLEEIAEAIHSLNSLGWTLSVVIVDDSRDNKFREIVQQTGNRCGIEVEVLDGPNEGLGSALIYGIRHCLDNPSNEFIVNLDADGQHDGRQIGELLRMASATDAGITVGSRWTKGGKCSGLSTTRRVFSRASSLALRISGVPWEVKDPTTSFRVYDRRTAEILVRELVGFNGFSFFGAGIAVTAAHGIKVNESPIHFRPRLTGVSNLNIRQTIRAISDLPRISAHSKMVRLRQCHFNPAASSQRNYSAHRELELLSSTPVSTSAIVDTLEPYIGQNVLEVGAGLGLITKKLAKSHKAVVSLEPDRKLFDQFTENISESNVTGLCMTIQDYLSSSDFIGKFDSVLYINVLEHIQDDLEELKMARSTIKPGGNIIIFVPAAPRLYGTMDWISGHFRRYRMDELKLIIAKADLNIVDCRAFDPIGLIPYWLLYRLFKRKKLESTTVKFYDRVIIPLSIAIPQSITRRVGGKNLIVVAQLPD